MPLVQNKLLESLSGLKENSRLVLYFSGTLNQCFALRNLLQKTNHDIAVYYFDKSKYLSDENDYKSQKNEIIKVLEESAKYYRKFDFREVSLNEDEVRDVKDLDDPIFHAKISQKLKKEIGFDEYLILEDQRFFENQLRVLKLFNEFEKQNFNILNPFSSLTTQEISKEALLFLNNYDIVLSKVYSDNKRFIDAIKTFDEEKDKESKLTDLIGSNFDYNLLYKYLLRKSSYNAYITFLKKFGNLVSRDLHINHLSGGTFLFIPSYELPITLSVIQGDIKDEELGKILIDKIFTFVASAQNTTQEKINEVDYFLRLFGDRISEEIKDQLLWKCFYWQGDYYNEKLIDKFVDWGFDIGDLLLRSIDTFPASEKSSRASVILKKYKDKIHQLQLNEALLKAFQHKVYDLCYRLIEEGANRKVIQFHSESYAEKLFYQTKSKEIDIKRYGHWRKRDRVIIAEILKELGNVHEKVPPVIHVTGSNGKGSTCAFLQSILGDNGYKAHAFTTSCVIRSNEDIIIAGEEISDEKYYEYLKRVEEAYLRIKDREDFKEKIKKANEEDGQTEEEAIKDGFLWYSIEISAAILAFAENKADVTIMEVITGGELDLTNVFSKDITIATIVNSVIFGDNHAGGKAFGDFSSIESVARTKSRLAKEGVPIFSAAQEDLAMRQIEETAKEKKSPLYVLGKDFFVKDLDDEYFEYEGFGKKMKLEKPRLAGKFQINNAALCLSSLIVNDKAYKLSNKQISSGIKKAYRVGRFSEVNNNINKHYNKVYYGSLKTSWGIKTFASDKIAKDSDAIFMSTTNDSYLYSLSYMDGNHILNFNKKTYIKNNKNDKSVIADKKILELSEKDSGSIKIKRYLSSAIIEIGKRSSNKLTSNLCIFSTGVNSFNDNHLIFLQIIKQNSFLKDLEFAKNNYLIEEEKYLLMKRSFSDHYFKRLHLGIITISEKYDRSSILLKNALESLGHKVTLIQYETGSYESSYDWKVNSEFIYRNNEKIYLKDFDGIMQRALGYASVATKYSEYFERVGVFVSHATSDIKRSDSKIETTLRLKESGVPVPESVILYFSEESSDNKIKETINSLSSNIKWPIVIKPDYETGGSGIIFPENIEDAVELVRKVKNDGHKGCVIQEFIKTSLPVESYRVYVVNNKCYDSATLLCKAYDNKNLVTNSQDVSLLLDDNLKKELGIVSELATKAMNLRCFSGVDLVKNEKGELFVLEVNDGPNFARLVDVFNTKLNIAVAEAFIKDVLEFNNQI